MQWKRLICLLTISCLVLTAVSIPVVAGDLNAEEMESAIVQLRKELNEERSRQSTTGFLTGFGIAILGIGVAVAGHLQVDAITEAEAVGAEVDDRKNKWRVVEGVGVVAGVLGLVSAITSAAAERAEDAAPGAGSVPDSATVTP